MTAGRAIWTVARREIVERSRTRVWRVTTLAMLALVVAGAIAAARSSVSTPSDDLAVVGPRSVALAPAVRSQAEAAGRRLRIRVLPSHRAATEAVREGRVDAAIVDGRILLVDRDDESPVVRVVQQAAAADATIDRLRSLGLSADQVADAIQPAALRVDVLDAQGEDAERDREMLAIGLLGLFLALTAYGNIVAGSVTEEKASRVIEVLLTTVPPRGLLAGKVLGVGLLGLAQVGGIGAAGLAAGKIAGGDGLPSAAAGTVALVVGWFVLGFAFYSVAYAAVGALVSRQEDLQAAVTPIGLLMIAAFFLAQGAAESPDATWVKFVAFLPPAAPLVVPARVVLGDMGMLGLVAAVAIQLAATLALIVVAARVYERAILRLGAPVKLRSVLRARVPGGRSARSPHASA